MLSQPVDVNAISSFLVCQPSWSLDLGFEGSQWVGLLAPAQTPASIVERLNTELNRIVRDPDMIAKFVAQGMLPAGGTPEEFSKLISSELKQWTEVARQAKVTAE